MWFGAVIRGDNEPIAIGDRTNIQEGAVLHTDADFPLTLGEGITVGHGAIVHGCTIGDNSLVGMGATILKRRQNRPQLSRRRQCARHRGQGVSRQQPDRRRPAKAVRVLDEAAVAGQRASAERYVANAKRFAQGCGGWIEDFFRLVAVGASFAEGLIDWSIGTCGENFYIPPRLI